MNNEIKEILELTIQFVEEELDKGTSKKDIIKSYSTAVGEAFNHIKNYITNLQEEKDMYKDGFETMSKNYFEEKSRNEKAIEKINCLIEDEKKKKLLMIDFMVIMIIQ